MLSSVRPLTRQGRQPPACMGVRGSPKACSRHCGKPWLSRPRLTDCCAIPLLTLTPTPWLPSVLRCCNLSSVATAFDEQSPHDAGHLVSESDGDQHLRLASEHLRQPRSFGRSTPAGLPNHGTRSNDQEPPDCSFAAFCDGAELLLSTGGSL